MTSPSQKNSAAGLCLREVSKSFGRERVLHNLDLDVRYGETTLLLGQNGSGKSTLLRISAGLSRADSGTIDRPKTIGYVGHQSLLYSALTVRENLLLAAELLRCEVDIDSYSAAWGISPFQGKPVFELSKGQHARVALARALIHAPDVVLLDEPTSALDEESTRLVFERLNALGTQAEAPAVLIATHDVARLEQYAQRAVILSAGAVAFDSAKEGGAVKSVIGLYRELNR